MPTVEQLAIPPQYGNPGTLLAWPDVETRLAGASHYWLATTRPDGRPHVVPLDGLWVDGRWYFGGADTTVRHRNLLADGRAALHLADATSAVIVDGVCTIEQPSDEFASDLAARSKAKYGYGPPASVYKGGVWALRPVRVMAWTDLTVDATRFLFEP